jgi:hypothetical protein
MLSCKEALNSLLLHLPLLAAAGAKAHQRNASCWQQEGAVTPRQQQQQRNGSSAGFATQQCSAHHQLFQQVTVVMQGCVTTGGGAVHCGASAATQANRLLSPFARFISTKVIASGCFTASCAQS